MKRPYVKEDVRSRVVKMLQKGYTYAATAEAFSIGPATVNRIWRKFRETGKTSLEARGGGTPPAISSAEEKAFERFVAQRPLATYDQLATDWSQRVRKKISRSAIVRHVLRLGFTRKKLTKKPVEKLTKKNRPKRSSFKFRTKFIDPEKLVLLDEAGFQSHSMPTYGRARRGVPATHWAPAARAKNVTQVGAIRMDGPVVMRGSPQAMTTRRFLSFMRCHLLPRLRPHDVLILDNLAAHRHPAVRRLARQWDVRVVYLPPYTPEFNPIEQVWAWMKQKLRRRLNRIKQCFRYAISGAWRTTSSLCFRDFFRHCGYIKSSHAI